MENEILKTMISDMKIHQYPSEEKENYYGRVIYSAMCHWIRYIILDEITENSSKKSKKYILQRGSLILNNLIDAIPECRSWFSEKSNDIEYIDKSIRKIRDIMIASGEIMESDNDWNINLPLFNARKINENYFRLLGLSKTQYNEKFVGVTRICCSIKSKKVIEYKEELEIIDLEKYMNWIYNNAEWFECDSIEKFEFFNPIIKQVPYQAWYDRPFNQQERYLGRLSSFNGLKVYYLFKYNNGKWYNAKFYEVLSNYKEQRRIILGLRKENNNLMDASFTKKGKVIILNLYCKIPMKEENFLNTYCWPLKSINDQLNYVIPIEVWKQVKIRLENSLGVNLKEY